MYSVIAASALVPIIIGIASFAIDRMEQITGQKNEFRHISDDGDEQQKKDPSHDMIDFSGGMFGI